MKILIAILFALSLLTGMTIAQDTDWKNYLAGHSIYSLASEGDYIWATTDSFLVKLEKSSGISTYIEYPGIEEGFFYKVKIDKKGRKWLLNVAVGLFNFDESNWKKISAEGAKISWLMEFEMDNNDNILISHGNGLSRYDGVSWINYSKDNSEIPYHSIRSLAVDNKGNIWMGNAEEMFTPCYRLVKYDGSTWTEFPRSNGFGDYFWQIEPDNEGNVRVLSHDYNIGKNVLLNFDGTEWTEICALGSVSANDFDNLCMAVGKNSKYWFGSSKGLACYDGSGWIKLNASNSMLPSDQVNSIVIDEKNLKWVATGNGLAVFEGDVAFGRMVASFSDLEMPATEIEIYPNPTGHTLNYWLPSQLKIKAIEIYTLEGKLINLPEVKGNPEIDVSCLKSGIYILRICTDEGIFLKKFIKQ